MPSIAIFIRELLSEEKYSSDFNDRIQERIETLNAAQLQGIYNHLKSVAKQAKSPQWIEANQELMHKIEGVLKIRSEEAAKERKVIEEYYLKQKQKRQLKVIAEREKIRVVQMVQETARKQAEEEVKENELKRQAAERVVILQEIAKAEDKRNFWWKVLAGFYICSLGAVSYVMRAQLFILVPGVFFITIVCLYLAYRAHLWTDIKPIVFSNEYMENVIEQKAEIYRKQAMSDIRERERKFQERQRQETKERRRLRRERRQKQQEEIELLEKERVDRINQAKFLLAKSLKESNGKFLGGVKIVPSMQDYVTNLENHSLNSSVVAVVDSDSETRKQIDAPLKVKGAGSKKGKKGAKRITFALPGEEGENDSDNQEHDDNDGIGDGDGRLEPLLELRDIEEGDSPLSKRVAGVNGDTLQINDYHSSNEENSSVDDLSSLEEDDSVLMLLTEEKKDQTEEDALPIELFAKTEEIV
jgi:hypothetical protein